LSFDPNSIYRTTKCFKFKGKYPGAFPKGFLNWCKKMGWWGNKRVYLCAGMVDDHDAIMVDIKPECNPTHLEDARHTSLPDKSSDCIILDTPYSKELAEKMYGTGKYWSGINTFLKEAERICDHGGIIIVLSYEVPRKVGDINCIACCGIYQMVFDCRMRSLTVWRKDGYVKQKRLDGDS